MQANVGGRDRAIRMISGVTLALAGVPGFGGYVSGSDVVSALLGGLSGLVILARIMLFTTGITQKCPVYSVIGIDTTE